MPEETRTFVNAADVLDNLRDNNMTTIDSVCELVDNSVDHNARNIWIELGKNKEGETYFIVQDDGEGIEKINIKKSLSLGGTLNEKYSHKIGRFGMGLSNACASQSPKSVLASKTKDDSETWTNEIDFAYLKENEAIFPKTYELKDKFLLSKRKFKDSGTFVYWTNCDNLDKQNHGILHRDLMEILSRVYRHFISEGRKIFVNGKKVEVFDPLCKLKNHRFKKEYGIERTYANPVVIPIEDGDGNVSNVIVELVLLDIAKIDQNPELRDKLKIGMRNQGLHLIRNGREIDNPQWYNVQTQKIDHLNYIRGEVRFESRLDKFFGIGHNKSKAFPKDIVLEKLKKMVGPLVSAALTEHRRRVQQKREAEEGGMESAKKVHEEVKKAIIPDEKLTEEELEVAKSTRKKKSSKKKEIKEEILKQIDDNPAISPEVKKIRKKKIEELFEGKYKEAIILTNTGPSSPIFQITYVDGGKRAIMLNADHKFYEHIYEPSMSNRDSRLLIEVALYSLADTREGLGDENFMAIFDQVVDRFSRRYGSMMNHSDVIAILSEARKLKDSS